MAKKSTHPTQKKKSFLYYEKYMMVIGIVGQSMFYAQGVKIFMNRSALNVSFLGFLAGFITVASWLIYGILIKNKVLIISNTIASLGALFVLIGILIHRA